MLIEKNKITDEDEKSFPIGISLNLYIEYNNHDNISNISDIMMDLDDSVDIVVIEFRYSLSLEMLETLKNDYQNYITRKIEYCNAQDAITSDETKMSDFCDFMKGNYKKYFKIEKNTREYDKKTKCAGSLRRPIENDSIIDKIIHFKSINARRTVSNSETNNALSYLFSEYYRRIEKKDSLVQVIEEFKKLVTETDEKLNSIYQGVFGGIIDKIRTFGGLKEGDTDVKILSSLQSRELLKGNTTVKYTHDENYQLPENYNGLGYLNLIGMIFEIEVILSEFHKDGKANEMPADIIL
jgi:hypothetical protein